MKLTPSFSLSLLATTLLLGLLHPAAALALDTGSSPLFGGTSLTIHGESFAWDLASSYEDPEYRYDIYTGATSGTTVTVTGLLSNTWLASVSGSGVDGFLQSGSYGDMSQNYSETGSFLVSGCEFTQHDYSASYTLDLMNQQLTSYGSDNYSASNGNYSYYSWDDSTGSSSYENNLAGDSQNSNSSNQFSLFGATYTWVSGTWSSYNSDDGTGYSISSNGWTDNFTSTDGGTLAISSYYDGYSYMTSTSVEGWDPYAGSFSAYYDGSFTDLGGLTWTYRSSPSFAPAQLWVNSTLVNWTGGSIDFSGNATDSYADSSSTTTLSISGNVRDFALNAGSASVSGDASGTYSTSGGFTDSTVLTYDPANQSTTYTAPFFTSATSLWVNSTEYPFDHGAEDSSGNRIDTYINESVGTVTLSGNTSTPSTAAVGVSYLLGSSESGTFTSPDTFDMPSLVITLAAPVLPVGPEAFWVRGRFYARAAADSNSFQTADADAALSLTDNGDGTLALAGTDATGDYSGSYDGGQGLFLLQDAQNAVLPAVPANADGTLQLAGETAPTDMPPAIMVVDGRIWVYWGTDTEDTAPTTTAAYYGSALHADTSAWVIKLRLDGSGTVTYTDYISGASAPGSYSTTTHLFQTSAPDNGFPVPIYGVDPNANHALWDLPQAATGIPATFLVGGQVWRYTGTDANGATLYQGYYLGQQLALASAVDGVRHVSVTDPVAGDTEGTLNDVRGSVRLADGRLAYSGSFDGAQINPNLNALGLQTFDGDLDITGNIITFGALSGSSATAGVTLQFADLQGADTTYTASLFNILSRPQAQWVWSRAADASALSILPVMQLDASSRLSLFDVGSVDESTGQVIPATIPGVVLDPTPDGVSTIRGALRVRPGGDISMGDDFKASPPGMTAP